MPSFVVETYVDGGDQDRFAIDVDGMRALAAKVGDAGQYRHIRSYFVPSDEMGFHVVEADSQETVIRLAEAAGIDVERIVSAVGVDPRDDAANPG